MESKIDCVVNVSFDFIVRAILLVIDSASIFVNLVKLSISIIKIVSHNSTKSTKQQ